MKPISLTVSGIGPYATKMPTLVFDELSTEGLFLITGPTGSGKTTIFDCVSYALFGVSSGAYRDSKNIKSEFAAEGTDCFVEFEFSHQGQRYIVKRNPAHRGRGARGFANISENATLYKGIDISADSDERKNNVVCEGISKVNDAIKDLLNVDKNQFKQVAMIAQGEFWELLNAKSDDRTNILRKIFLTSPYLKMGEILKEKKDASFKKIDVHKTTMISMLSDCQADEESELFERLETIKQNALSIKSVWNMDEISEIMDAVVSEDESQISEWSIIVEKAKNDSYEKNRELAISQSQNKAIETRDRLRVRKEELIGRAEEIEKLENRLNREKIATHKIYPIYNSKKLKRNAVCEQKKSIEESEEQKKIAEESLLKAKKKLDECAPNKDKADMLSKEAVLLKNEEKAYIERDSVKVSLQELDKKKELLLKNASDANERESSIKKQIEELAEEEKQLKSVTSNVAQAEIAVNKSRDLLNDFENLLDKTIPDYEKKQSLYEDLKANFSSAMQAYEKARNEYNTAKDQADLNKAGILRKSLVEGKPCPVCGEIFHASNGGLECLPLAEIEIDDATLEKLSERLAQAEEKKNIVFEEISSAKAACESTFANIKDRSAELTKRAKELSGEEIIDYEYSQLIEQISRTRDIVAALNESRNNAYNEITEKVKKLDEVSKNLINLRDEELVKLSSEKESIKEELSDITAKKAKLEGQLVSIGKLKFETVDAAITAREGLEKEAQALLAAIDLAKEELERASKEVASCDSEINAKKQIFEKLKNEADLLDREFRDSLADNGFASEEIYFTFVSSEDKISDSEKIVNNYMQDMKSVSDQLEMLEKDTDGKKLIDLAFLQEEVERLNNEFDALSSKKNIISNRYQLNKSRKENFDKLSPDFKKAQAEFSTYDTLYNLVSGADDGTKKGKLTLEQFVQASGFDGIIRAANKRLIPMSEGRYELRRKEFSGTKTNSSTSLGSKTNTAFDLVVMDYYTGITRPVGDLSGGESFIASLSLALGLSDTVSMQRGGLQMDALFIDEGFGTLDSELIDTVMKVLTDLSQANKMVGIISHREELMQNIHKQIVVEKGRTGSSYSVLNTE